MKKVRKAKSTTTVDFLINNERTVRGKYAIRAMALSRYIDLFKENSNFKQNEIAANLEMKESQLSKWLSGFHNLTLQSILKLESACTIEILNPAIWNGTSLEKSRDKGVFNITIPIEKESAAKDQAGTSAKVVEFKSVNTFGKILAHAK